MNELVLSVIVPVYNTAPWLRRCLDSICEQSYRNLEILCVNDGSTDDSAEILAEYAARDARIRVFTQENAGLSAARNTALEHATGEWVTGVDSDDYLAPDVYERAVTCILPEVDMVFFGVQEVTEETVPMPHREYFDLPGAGVYEMTPELAKKLNVCFWSKLWRRSVLELHQLRFPHGLVHEDVAMFCMYAPHARKVTISPEMGYYYVQRAGSIMNGEEMTHARRYSRYIPALEFTCAQYKSRCLLKDSRREYLIGVLINLCSNAYWLEDAPDRHELLQSFADLFLRYGVERMNYLLERMVPLRWWQRLYLRRCAGARMYCLFGVPIVGVQFDGAGHRVRVVCYPYEWIKFRKA